jgi:hypothetical protein
MALNAVGCAMISVNSISSRSPGTLHEYGASQRMDGAGFDRRKIGAGDFWPDLTVQSITGLQGDFFAFLDLCDRRDIGMIAVVSDMRFLCDRFAAIDTDGLHVYLPYF